MDDLTDQVKAELETFTGIECPNCKRPILRESKDKKTAFCVCRYERHEDPGGPEIVKNKPVKTSTGRLSSVKVKKKE
jgi:ssDNA-binding Zn-finger/Zn-ribbon topoisomerase 1